MEQFSCKTLIVSGSDALSVLKRWANQRLFLVTQPELPLKESLAGALPAGLFSQVIPWHPEGPQAGMLQAVEGSRQLKATQPDLVLAIGEPWVLDSAKAAVCFSGLSCPLAVVPTLPGSGTEVTGRVCLSHDRRLHSLRNERMQPDVAILESSLLKLHSRSRLAESGFLLLSQTLESYTARGAGTLSSLHAREGFCGCWAALSAAVVGNSAAGNRLLYSSCLAGLSLDGAGLGLCHALTGSLENVCHLPRGRLAAVVLPSVMAFNAHAAGHRLAALARGAGISAGNEAAAVGRLRTGLMRLRRDLGLPATLAQAGADPGRIRSNLPAIVRMTLEDPECPNNPLTVDDFTVRRILEEVTGRI